MAGGFDDLYQALILDHYRKPRNRGDLPGADRSAELLNPLCGDEIAVELKLDGDRISEVRFHGHGCSISQASTSVLTDQVIGVPLGDALKIVEGFVEMVGSRGTVEGDEDLIGDGIAFAGVAKYPARVKCALLGWMAFKDAVAQTVDAAPADLAGGAHTLSSGGQN